MMLNMQIFNSSIVIPAYAGMTELTGLLIFSLHLLPRKAVIPPTVQR